MRPRTIVGTLLAAIGTGAVVARRSPDPAVRVVRFLFDRAGNARNELLLDQVPGGICTRSAIRYGEQPDELLDVHRPEDAGDGPLPVIVWIHGGGWVSGGREQIANYLKIVAHAGFAVVGVDYTKAPAATFPTPVRQVNAALAHLVRHAQELGLDADRIVLAGDSAGAQIAAQVAMLTTNERFAAKLAVTSALSEAQLRGTILYCGPYDRTLGSTRSPIRGFVRATMWAYTGARDYGHVDSLDGLDVVDRVDGRFPPTFISVGNADPLEAHSVRLADRLEEHGVDVTRLFFARDYRPLLTHEYQFVLDDEAAREALAQSLEFAGRVTS